VVTVVVLVVLDIELVVVVEFELALEDYF